MRRHLKDAAARSFCGRAKGDTRGLVQGQEADQARVVGRVEGSPVPRFRGRQLPAQGRSRGGRSSPGALVDCGFYSGSVGANGRALLRSNMDFLTDHLWTGYREVRIKMRAALFLLKHQLKETLGLLILAVLCLYA